MLNTQFPRVIGDIGNPETFDFNVNYEKVLSAAVSSIVTSNGIAPSVKQDIFNSLDNLQNKRVNLIVTTCGFLGEMQNELKAFSNTPILTSSLLTIPFARVFLNKTDDKIGVLTFDSKSLNSTHFGGNYSNDIIIGDIPKKGELYKTIKNDLLTLNTQKAEIEVVTSALELIKQNPTIKIIVLECTNLSPYIDAVKKATQLPVFDIIQAIHWYKKTQ